MHNLNWVTTRNKNYFRFKCRHCGVWKNVEGKTKKKSFINGFCRNACARMFQKADFYRSQEWMNLRYRALKAYGAKCRACGSDEKLHVDHIKPRSKYPLLELDLNNLQVLCGPCNLGKGAWDETDWRS